MSRRFLVGVSLVVVGVVVNAAAGSAALAQTAVDPVVQVQGIAPQLVSFAGSDANFRSLVLGLSQGTAVTLVTTTSDGLVQTVSFTPATPLSPTDIARTLESVRQQLIGRGVSTPTAQQIGTVLAGGNLPTPLGTVAVPASITTVTPGGVQSSVSAAAGASVPARTGTTNPTSNLNIDIRPAVAPAAGTGAATAPTTATGPTPVTSTPLPVTTGPVPVMSGPNPVFSGPNPVFTTTPAPATSNPNGATAPAVQMQGRR